MLMNDSWTSWAGVNERLYTPARVGCGEYPCLVENGSRGFN
jgi:hypothetical protein